MAKISILTLTEQRDLVVDERIAQALRGKGHEVVIRNYVHAGQDSVCFEKPDLVVMPMVGSVQKFDFARRCHEWGIGVVVRRGEAGAARTVLENLTKDRQTIMVGGFEYGPHVDLELTWGREFADILVERGRITPEKVVPCGAFTLDGCFNRVRPVRTGRKVLLFATAWSAADDDPDYTECGLPADSPMQKALYREHRRGRDLWLQVLHDLYMTKGHKYEMMLKVRPGERLAEYQEKVGKFVRILPYEFPSAEAIAMSDCVIHAGSTMAVEAHLLGVPTLNYVNANPDSRVAALAPQCHDFAELTDALGRMAWGHSNIHEQELDWLRVHLYGPIDGHACDRAANAIHKHAAARQKAKRKTKIPDRWPHDVRYPSECVSLQSSAGHHRMTCVSCNGEFGLRKDVDWCLCPFCGMSLRKVYLRMKKAS